MPTDSYNRGKMLEKKTIHRNEISDNVMAFLISVNGGKMHRIKILFRMCCGSVNKQYIKHFNGWKIYR